jgi:hypothetical protein
VFASGHVAGLLFTLATAVEAHVVELARKLELAALAKAAIEAREYAFEVTQRLKAAKRAPS